MHHKEAQLRLRRAKIVGWSLFLVWAAICGVLWLPLHPAGALSVPPSTPPDAAAPPADTAYATTSTTYVEERGLFRYAQVLRTVNLFVNRRPGGPAGFTVSHTTLRPFGFLATLAITAAGGLLVWWVPRRIKGDPTHHGECPACGYDMRHVKTNICPKCGAENLPQSWVNP